MFNVDESLMDTVRDWNDPFASAAAATEKIVARDPSITHLCFNTMDPDNYFRERDFVRSEIEELITALEEHGRFMNITYVHMNDRFIRALTCDGDGLWRRYLQVVGAHLPRLEVFRAVGKQASGSPTFLEILSALNHRLSQLKRFEFPQELRIRPGDISRLARMLSQMTRLEDYSTPLLLYRGRKNSILDVTPILSALLAQKNLKKLAFGKEIGGNVILIVSHDCITALCRKSSLQEVQFGLRLDDSDMAVFCKGLISNTSLERLDLQFCHGFDLTFHGLDACASMMSKQQTLKELELCFSHCPRLKNLPETLCPYRRIRSFCHLNKANRGEIMNNPGSSREAWAKLLEAVSDDVGALYYVLSKNPAICNFPRGDEKHVYASDETLKRRAEWNVHDATSKQARRR